MKRRDFIRTTAAGITGLALRDSAVHAFGRKPKHYDAFQKVKLGNSGIETTLLGLGTGMHGSKRSSSLTRMGEKKAKRFIRAAYDRGIRMFDCADLYGTHPLILSALKDVPREDICIVSKIWFRRGGIPEPERPAADVVIDRFRKELNTDYIDIVQLHCAVSPEWQTEQAAYRDMMEELKAKGIIRAHGVSCHRFEAMRLASEDPWVDVMHARINAYGNYMDDTPEKVAELVKKAHLSGKGVIGMKLIGQGEFHNDPEKRQESIRFALHTGAVNSLIVGFEEEAQMDDCARMVNKVPVLM